MLEHYNTQAAISRAYVRLFLTKFEVCHTLSCGASAAEYSAINTRKITSAAENIVSMYLMTNSDPKRPSR